MTDSPATSTQSRQTLMVIDGHSLAFRAFYALPLDNFINREGQHTNAIHGFLSMLLKIVKDEAPTHLAVAFDISRFSFRTREYPEYKGTRAETPVEFKGQVPLLQEALAAMNITTITKEDYEADDILATLAREGAEADMDVLVVSGDRDTIQLVNDRVTLLYPSVRGVSELKRYTPETVHEKYGIAPEQYPEIAALVGETSDNLIGIDKVGEKTAVKWISQYGTVDNLLEHADDIKGVVGGNLRDQRDRAIRNRRLNRLVNDVELPVKPTDLERQPIDPPAVREVFSQKLNFRTLLDRVLALAEDQGLDEAPAPAEEAPKPAKLIDEELDYWLERSDAEVTVSVSAAGESVAAFGLARGEETVFVPFESQTGDYVGFRAWLAGDAPKAVHDYKALERLLQHDGMTLGGVTWDTRIAAWLQRPGAPAKMFGLAPLVEFTLGMTLPEPDPNQLLPDDDPDSLAAEAWMTAKVVEAQREGLDKGTVSVLADIELPLVRVLSRMERTGIHVDFESLQSLHDELRAQAAEHQEAAFAEIGHEVNLGSPKQLQTVLFEELEMPKTRATKTGYSTDAASLADLQESNPHPFLGLLLKYREATKLAQMIESLTKAVVDSRIHTTYDQTGSATGRMSSNDPNLQNIPVRTEVSHRIREGFDHDERFETLLTADYSQIEMRIMAHLSEDPGLIEAFNSGEDLHRFVGARIFSVEPEEVTPVMRTKVKAMSYGLAYGLSAFGLSKQLRIPQSEAKQLMLDYFERFGAVRDYLRGVVQQAKDDGYTTTIFGRRRPFPDLKSSNRVLRENAERAALNSPIQGSAADIIKRAMLTIDKAMTDARLQSNMLLQVHDELVFEVADGELDQLKQIVIDGMGSAADLTVPLDVQIGIGANWNEAAH
ncbi:DNA polymerase I [Agrococcus casei]|uniref:DNA polymerase I n=1 Tax=Agrococcus casei LMG 22410 TaxID=1255656 RepID=A0A1R4FQR8_9MICO|nr:DNA polymerase I [Agrococcus casei]SJM58360.1 DNA polymerase I [Agrococcus casei LMG 22410]